MTKQDTRFERCARASIVLMVFLGAVAGYIGIVMMADSQGVKFELTQAVSAATGLKSLFWIGLLVFCVDCVLTGGLVWLLINDSFQHRKKTFPVAVLLAGSCAALLYSGAGNLFYSYICLPAVCLLLVISIVLLFIRPTPLRI